MSVFDTPDDLEQPIPDDQTPLVRPEPGDVDADPNEPQAEAEEPPPDLDPEDAPDPEDDEGLDQAEQSSAGGW